MNERENQKLDIILEKIDSLKSDVSILKSDVSILKSDVSELKVMQQFTFDEVERVHQILEKHIEDTTCHVSFA